MRQHKVAKRILMQAPLRSLACMHSRLDSFMLPPIIDRQRSAGKIDAAKFPYYLSIHILPTKPHLHLSTLTPCPTPTVPPSTSTSFTVHLPMSHWHVKAVAQAFIRHEKAGKGRENMICSG